MCHLAVFCLDFNFTKFMKFMVSLTFKLAVCVASDDHKHHCLCICVQLQPKDGKSAIGYVDRTLYFRLDEPANELHVKILLVC